MTRIGPTVVVCVLVSGASLGLPAAIGFDPWAWLVWGREITGLELDTTGGPSWKPLPVVITTILAPFGAAAPTLWVVIARTAGLMLVVGAFRIASRFGGTGAGASAAALLVLTPDAEPRFLRTLLEAHGAPMAAALALWALDRHLDGQRGTALVLGVGLALMRPEAWPFLVAYAAWLWARHPPLRGRIVPALAVVPILWFGGDLWGAGHPLHGADAAQVAAGDLWARTSGAVRTAADMVALPVWVAAAATVVVSHRRGERTLPWLAAMALAWSGIVVAMAVALRYAAISRFFLPAAAVVSVVAAIGVVWAIRTLPRTIAGAGTAVAALLVALALTMPRVVGLADVAEEIDVRAGLQADLDRVIELAGGRDAVLSCGPVAVDGSALLRPAVAWKLGLPLADARRIPHARPGVWFTDAGGRTDRELASRPVPGVELVVRSAEWALYRVDCPTDTLDLRYG